MGLIRSDDGAVSFVDLGELGTTGPVERKKGNILTPGVVPIVRTPYFGGFEP